MSNSVFANFRYGIKVEMTPDEKDLFDRTNNKLDCAEDEVESGHLEYTLNLLFRAMAHRLTEHYGLSNVNDIINVIVIDENEAMANSGCTEGCIFGIGVLNFPEVCNSVENRINIAKLTAAGAEWHSWVT